MSASAHHDGSPLYVSDSAPTLGDTITVRLRIPRSWSPDFVGLRWIHDGEGQVTSAVRTADDSADVWWEAPLHIRNPLAKYRWVLSGGNVGYGWLNGPGWHDHDVTDADDYKI